VNVNHDEVIRELEKVVAEFRKVERLQRALERAYTRNPTKDLKLMAELLQKTWFDYLNEKLPIPRSKRAVATKRSDLGAGLSKSTAKQITSQSQGRSPRRLRSE
jgi:hypothetical protein